MKLPTEQQCLNYFVKYKVPDNIFKHCCAVRNVAVFLAARLKEKNVPINAEFVNSLALFHDLCKMIVIKDFGRNDFHKDAVITPEQAAFWHEMQQKYPRHYEGEVAYELFKDLYPELALSLQQVSNPQNEAPKWEEMVVHYADWRVLGEKVVSLAERVAYLRQRYQRSDDTWNKYGQTVRQQEQKIFSFLSFAADGLAAEMETVMEKNSLIKIVDGAA